MLGRYLKILDESLDKKLALLKEIEDLSLSQSVMIEDGAAFEDIDANMDDKAALIDRINKLDEGFQAMYDNIKENLEAQKEEYKDEIEVIKKTLSILILLSRLALILILFDTSQLLLFSSSVHRLLH